MQRRDMQRHEVRDIASGKMRAAASAVVFTRGATARHDSSIARRLHHSPLSLFD
jgi:hypothetical protein